MSSRAVHDRVQVKQPEWSKYYGGAITAVNPDGTYDITCDDGERLRFVPATRIQNANYVPPVQPTTTTASSSSSSSATGGTTGKTKSSSYAPDTDSSSLTNMKKTADYLVQESYQAETQDHEDHTFCGVMFDVQTKKALPLEFIEISSVWVRGGLGPLAVYWTKDTYKNKSEDKEQWQQVYAATHKPSPYELVELIFTTPIHLQAGDAIGMYVHSTQPGDQAIVRPTTATNTPITFAAVRDPFWTHPIV